MDFNPSTQKKSPKQMLRAFVECIWRHNKVAPSPADQWNCSSSVEPVRAFTEDEPPWITVVTSSK